MLSPSASELDEKDVFLALTQSHILEQLHLWIFPRVRDKQPTCTEEQTARLLDGARIAP